MARLVAWWARISRFELCFAALVALDLALVWALPVLPFQDLPQHLAYARIILDHDRADLPFAARYSPPVAYQSYFATHYLLAGVGSFVGVLTALRVLLSAYVLGLFLAFRALVRELQDPVARRSPPWPALSAQLVVWNPAAMMGFVAFTLALPLFVAGVALLLRCRGGCRRRDLAAYAVVCVLLNNVHVVAGGLLLLLAALHLAFAGRAARLRVLLPPLLGVLGPVAASLLWWGSDLGRLPGVPWREILDGNHGLTFLNEVLRLSWRDPLTKVSYALHTVLGPYALAGQMLMLAVAFLSFRAGRRAGQGSGPERSTARTAAAFAILCFAAPWALHVPTELTYLDLRAMTFAFALVLAVALARRLDTMPRRVALLALCGVSLGQFAARAWGFSAEARSVLGLLAQARPAGVMSSLTFANRSEHFAAQFAVTHFLPMYYTVVEGGINTQFWARYTEHLPVDYRPGQALVHTTDWRPWEYVPGDLRGADYLLVQRPDARSSWRQREGWARIEPMVARVTSRLACDGLWCLYRVTGTEPVSAGPGAPGVERDQRGGDEDAREHHEP